MPGTLSWAAIEEVISASGSTWSSLQIPRSSGEMRPRGSTAVASVITRPAPPTARLARCWACQSVARPSRSSQEYWHIGETITRFGIVVARIDSGVNRSALITGGSRPGEKYVRIVGVSSHSTAGIASARSVGFVRLRAQVNHDSLQII